MMNLLKPALATLVLSAGVLGASVRPFEDIKVTVNQEEVNFPDTPPTMINSRVMVPMRGVFEAMDANVTWDGESQSVDAIRGPDNIRLKIGVYSARVNEKNVGIDVPAVIYKGRTMVPLRFVSQCLHANVDWIASKRLVEITTTK